MRRRALLLCALLSLAPPPLAFAQAPAPAPASPPADEMKPDIPPIRRWIEFQTLTTIWRYRFIENSADVTTATQIQYKDVIRGRFNFDAKHRYTINVGVFTGQNFISTWNSTSIGTGDFTGSHSLKQLFASAIPVDGLEFQYGGLYIVRGENTEVTTYDEDGYLVGERVSVRRGKDLFFDEISATRAYIGPFNKTSLTDRWTGLHESNYRQLLIGKRITPQLRASGDYTYDQGAESWHAGVAMSFKHGAPLGLVRYEQYRRMTPHAASGFAVTAERPIAGHARLSAGYTTIDELYGGWNGDRIQRGKRVFGVGTIPLNDELTLSVFATQAVDNAYPISNRTRVDVLFTYDLLRTLRKARLL